MIKASKLNNFDTPKRTALYKVVNARDILVEEKQQDGSMDQVILEYCVKEGNIGYFAKEYRPASVKKEGAKVIDLYDIKDTLAGEDTAVKLYNQWNFMGLFS